VPRASTTDPFESEIEAARARLAETIDTLAFRANPKNMVSREVHRVAAFFVDDQGAPRTDNVLRVAGAVVGFVAVVAVIRKVTR
jgi:hypothetical protein